MMLVFFAGIASSCVAVSFSGSPLQMAVALNRKCGFYESAADALMTRQVAGKRAAILARPGSRAAGDWLDEEARILEAAVAANAKACEPALA